MLYVSHDSKDYPYVTLKKSGKGKRHRIYRLVTMTFIPNPENLPQVNHKDKDNNVISNLEWYTNKYNGIRLERIANSNRGKSTHNSILITINGITYDSISKASKDLGLSTYKIKKLYGN